MAPYRGSAFAATTMETGSVSRTLTQWQTLCYTSAPYPWSCFSWFQLLSFNRVKKIWNENLRNEHFRRFAWCAVLNSMAKSSLRPACSCCLHCLPVCHLPATSVIRLTVVVPQCVCVSSLHCNCGPKVPDAGHSDTPRKHHKLLPLGKKMSIVQ